MFTSHGTVVERHFTVVKHIAVLSTDVKLCYFYASTLLEMLFYFWPFATLIGIDSTERTANVGGNDIGK